MMVRPMMALLGALRAREVEAVELAAAARAVSAERSERLTTLQNQVRPLLQRIADGDSFTQDEALHIRILENSLRDEVRAPGWSTEGIRQVVALARLRGVRVQLFDDGGLDMNGLSARDAERLRGEVIRVLSAAESGSVTARILPPERDHVAVINIGTEDGHDRRICRWTTIGLHWTTRAGDVRAIAE